MPFEQGLFDGDADKQRALERPEVRHDSTPKLRTILVKNN
jgi:hypothetical protein